MVGKIEWDADAGGEDVIAVVRFLETDPLNEAAFDAQLALLPALSSRNWASNKPDLDQSQFDTLNFSSLKFFVDEIRIGTTFQDIITGGAGPAPLPFRFEITSNEPNLDLEWESQAGRFYNLRSSTGLETEFSTWELVEVGGGTDLASTPPLNRHTIPRPEDPTVFYRVEELLLPPVTVFEENVGICLCQRRRQCVRCIRLVHRRPDHHDPGPVTMAGPPGG